MPAYCASSGAVVLASQQFVDGSIFIRPATVEGKKKSWEKISISLSHQRQHSFTASVFLVPASHSIKGDSGVLIARQII